MTSPPVILIIDDEAQIRRFLRVSLEAAGYRLVEAVTGEDGIVQAAMSHPDIVILDLAIHQTCWQGLDPPANFAGSVGATCCGGNSILAHLHGATTKEA